MTPKPGDSVTNNVRLVAPLGAGGMGTVWLAEHRTLRTQVVVKFIHERIANRKDSLARFQREASAAAQVKSPHVVQMLDAGVTHNGMPYIMMELLQGEGLGDYLQRAQTMSPQETARMMAHVASALAAAHGQGIIHRDLKPNNIFLTQTDGELFAKVLDFGIAKSHGHGDTVTRTGVVLGTPFYMSPEQLMNPSEAKPAADLWALAVVAYEALTGARPFTAPSLAGLFDAIRSSSFISPSQCRPSLPKALDHWFAKALAQHPQQRFQNAAEMAKAFKDAIQHGETASATHKAPAITDDEAEPTVVMPRHPIAATEKWLAPSLEPPIMPASMAPPAHATTNSPNTTIKRRGESKRWGLWLIAALSLTVTLGVMGILGAHLSTTAEVQSDTALIPSQSPPETTLAQEPASTTEPIADHPTIHLDEEASTVAVAPEVAQPQPGYTGLKAAMPVEESDEEPKCVGTKACRVFGRCTPRGDRCLATRAEDCQRSMICRVDGKCALGGGVCIEAHVDVEEAVPSAKPSKRCRGSAQCRQLGECSLVGGVCRPASNADCQKSAACYVGGRCSLMGGRCQARSRMDCRQSQHCRNNGRCRVQAGRCVR